MAITCIQRLFNNSVPFCLNPPTLGILAQSSIGILPPERRDKVVILQKIARLVHQSRIAARREMEALSWSMVSVNKMQIGLQIMGAGEIVGEIMKTGDIVGGLEEGRMIMIQSQLHSNVIVTPGKLIHPLLHDVELLVEHNPGDLRDAIVHVHNSEKLEAQFLAALPTLGPPNENTVMGIDPN